MIIKSKGYKSEKAFKTVVRYVLKEEELEQGFLLIRFIKGKDKSPEAISRQFYLNEQYRIHKRKNNVKLYMDILSFKKEDSKHLTNEKLKKIARKYILLRANHSISIATVHRDKDHTHLHIVYGIEYKTGRSVRISKEAFQNDIKLEMERFQEREFTELALSKIDHLKNIKKKP